MNPNDFGDDDEDEREYEDAPDYDDDDSPEGEERARNRTFANPGSNSALRAASASNPRVHPCPSCGSPNRLTPADVARGYQCDPCADRDERGGY
jgi:hypothetical protein